jgi:hypothetical protein
MTSHIIDRLRGQVAALEATLAAAADALCCCPLGTDTNCGCRSATLAELIAHLWESLLEANPLVFGSDGTIDHDLPLGVLIARAAEKIIHLRKLHAEAIEIAERREIALAQQRTVNVQLAERLAACSELLGRAAERRPGVVLRLGEDGPSWCPDTVRQDGDPTE